MQASGLGNKSNNNIDMIMYNDTTAKKTTGIQHLKMCQ